MAEIIKGYVVSVNTVTAVYRVRGVSPDSPSNIYATELNGQGQRIFGVKDHKVMPLGTYVLVYVDPEKANTTFNPGVLLGAYTHKAIDPNKKNPQDLKTTSTIQGQALIANKNNDLTAARENTVAEQDFAFGRPVDAQAGEWGKTGALGTGIFVGDFLSYLKASEKCKFEMFLLNDEARLTIETLQIWTPASEQLNTMDHNISKDVVHTAINRKEGLGGLKKAEVVEKAEADDKSPADKKAKSTMGFFRMQEYRGGLMDGWFRSMALPPKSDNYDPTVDIAPGVFSEHVGIDGSYTLKAAQSVSIEKSIIIPIPQRISREDVPQAELGKREIEEKELPEEEKNPSMFGVEGADCQSKYNNEKVKYTQVRIRDKMYSIPSNDEKTISNITNALEGLEEVEMKTLGEEPYYTEPPMAKVPNQLDDEGNLTGESKISALLSAIKLLPDGGVSFQGGYGETIKFYRGNIVLSCPGDIIEVVGRDKISFSGRHNIIKAKEIVENTGRLLNTVAEESVQISSANGENKQGAIILDSKAEGNIALGDYLKDGTISGGGVLIKGPTILQKSDNIRLEGVDYNRSSLQIKSRSMSVVSSQVQQYIQEGGIWSVGTEKGSLALNNDVMEYMGMGVMFGVAQVKAVSATVQTDFLDKEGEVTSKTVGSSMKGSALIIGGQCITREAFVAPKGKSTVAEMTSENMATIFDPKYFPGKLVKANKIEHYKSEFTYDVDKDLYKKLGVFMPEYNAAKFEIAAAGWQNTLKGGDTLEFPKLKNPDNTDVQTFPGKDALETKGSLKKLSSEGKVVKQKLGENLVINK